MQHIVSDVFTARIVYADSDETPALIPQQSQDDWKWECTGTQGVDFNLDPMGNEARYTHLSGDFMDRIITAKCKIDAGIFTGKRSGKAVDRFVWVEGDNQVPVCLVNEDGRRIKTIPIVNPDIGLDRNTPPYNDQIEISIEFTTGYSSNVIDTIQLAFNNTDLMGIDKTVLSETTVNSKLFKSADNGFEIFIRHPDPGVISKSDSVRAGTDKMVLDLKHGEHSAVLSIPIWQGPGIDGSAAPLYFASNMVFESNTCGKIDPAQYIPADSRFCIAIVDQEAASPSVLASLESDIDKIDEVVCVKKNGRFVSEPFIAVNENFSGNSMEIGGKSYRTIRVGQAQEKLRSYYTVRSKYKGKESVNPGKLGAYCIKGFNFLNWMQTIGGTFEATAATISDQLHYHTLVDFSPTKSEVRKDLEKNKFRIFYSVTHGDVDDVNNPNEFAGIGLYSLYVPFTTWGINHNTLTVDEISPQTEVEFVFLNACASGKPGWEKFKQAFNAKVYMGWKTSMRGHIAQQFGYTFFQYCRKPEGEEREKAPSVYTAAENTIKNIFYIDEQPVENSKLFIDAGDYSNAKNLILAE
ncbi:MAG: hypothetical protein PHQ23_13585 [Candidatus Wallbacteria bacterium]|nr:hypothetical protein [Candidatus Wallbacteria bacterium]